MIENISEIENGLGLESGKLSEMLTSEEKHTVDLSERVILDKASYDERISNIKKDSSTMALEIAIKEQRNALGLEFEGKTMENLLNSFKTKIESESKIEPETKYKTLKTDFETLQSKLLEKDSEFNTFKDNLSKEQNFNDIKNEFMKYVPDNALVSKSTLFVEAKEKGFDFVKEEGKVVVKDAQGNTLKNENLSALDIKDWVATFSTPYLPKVEGGAGAKDDTPPSKAGSLEAFQKQAEKNGWNATKTNDMMMAAIKDGTLKL